MKEYKRRHRGILLVSSHFSSIAMPRDSYYITNILQELISSSSGKGHIEVNLYWGILQARSWYSNTKIDGSVCVLVLCIYTYREPG